MSLEASKRTSSTARLKHDYLRIKKDPVPYVVAEPLPSNILEWHYIIEGPEDTPYEGGFYHGKLIFPKQFPFKPPSIYMITPNGRFVTNSKLCLSISDYHPDSWNPAWSVATILTGLLSFMVCKINDSRTEETKTLGSIKTSTREKRQLAYQSVKYTFDNKIVQELFPDICEKMKDVLEKRRAQQANAEGAYQFLSGQQNERSTFFSTLTNIAVVLGFAAFAYSVEYVLKNVAYD